MKIRAGDHHYDDQSENQSSDLSARASFVFGVQTKNTSTYEPSSFINRARRVEQTGRARCDNGHTPPIFRLLNCFQITLRLCIIRTICDSL